MTAKTQPAALRNAVTSVLAAAVLAGCASAIASPRNDRAEAVARAQQFIARGQAERAIPVIEGAVASEPRDAALRVLLGQAYLKAGRFQSAAAAFDDAMTLGENSSRTALSLALAHAANGNGREAVAILDDWRDAIPVSDYGLALALAGETGRGVAVLADAVRAGDNTPKVRQNLAYAYSLDGRWREARLMAQQDVPADQVGDRLTQWAMNSRPEDHQARVAALIGVGVRQDAGMPQALALSNTPSAEQLAAEVGAVPSQQRSEAALAHAELPPVQQTAAPALAMATAAPVPAYVPPAAPAYAPDATPVYTPVAAPAYEIDGVRFVENPVIQQVPPSPAPARAEAPRPRAATPRAVGPVRVAAATPPVAPRPVAGGGTHLVQLGSFFTQQGARRAWGIYTAQNPALRNYRMTITQAQVRGRTYWRVAAAGFDAGSATGYCATLRRSGGACFAYAATRGMPGQIIPNQRQGGGVQNARRR